MLRRFLVLWLSLLSLVSYQWPAWFPEVWDPFANSKEVLPYLIMVTMFCIGWMLPRDEVRQVATRWPMVLAGTALQYTSMPLLSYACGKLMGLEGAALIGVVIAGSVPGAMASNVLTHLARGNTSYSVSLTTSATLLSPIVVPLWLKLLLSGSPEVTIDGTKEAIFLLWTVVAPVVIGHLVGRSLPRWERQAEIAGSTIANVTILWIIAVVVGLNRQRLQGIEDSLLAALVLLNVLGYLAGYAGGIALRLPEPMRRALTLEIGMQNAGLGATLATQMFPDQPATAIGPALYMFGCMFSGSLMAQIWSRFPPKESPAEQNA